MDCGDKAMLVVRPLLNAYCLSLLEKLTVSIVWYCIGLDWIVMDCINS